MLSPHNWPHYSVVPIPVAAEQVSRRRDLPLELAKVRASESEIRGKRNAKPTLMGHTSTLELGEGNGVYRTYIVALRCRSCRTLSNTSVLVFDNKPLITYRRLLLRLLATVDPGNVKYPHIVRNFTTTILGPLLPRD